MGELSLAFAGPGSVSDWSSSGPDWELGSWRPAWPKASPVSRAQRDRSAVRRTCRCSCSKASRSSLKSSVCSSS